MATNGVNGNYNYVSNYSTHHKAKGESIEDESKATKTAAETAKGAETEPVKKQSEAYKPDLDKIREMKSDLRNNIAAFKKMVFGQVKDQKNNADQTMSDLLKSIADISPEEAAKAVADDGEWGVEATANRILDFAKALSGGDPSKIDTLRDAVKKGFAAAGQVWGGDLPEISQQTYDRIMEGFDEWANSGNANAAQAQAAGAIQ